jgi:hypothetical protein
MPRAGIKDSDNDNALHFCDTLPHDVPSMRLKNIEVQPGTCTAHSCILWRLLSSATLGQPCMSSKALLAEVALRRMDCRV